MLGYGSEKILARYTHCTDERENRDIYKSEPNFEPSQPCKAKQ